MPMNQYSKSTAVFTCPNCDVTEKMNATTDTLAGVTCVRCPSCGHNDVVGDDPCGFQKS